MEGDEQGLLLEERVKFLSSGSGTRGLKVQKSPLSVVTLKTQASGGLWHNALLSGSLGGGWQGGKSALFL